MLSEGIRAAFQYLGHDVRTVAHVELEAHAASQLVALMEAGCLDPAPIWSDMLTFDARRWRGCVDIVASGFPCTDISIAGRREGLDGKRSGLFFEVVRIATDCEARFLMLENVAAIATSVASVVDEEEGVLDERAAARVVGELADRGWDSEWITLSASDVGASHGRNRWFCFAWRVAHTGRGSAWRGEHVTGAGGSASEYQHGIETLGNTGRVQRRAGHEQDRPGSAEASGNEADNRPTNRSGHVAHTEQPVLQRTRGGGMKGEQLNNFVEHSPSSPQAQQIPDGQESSQSTDTLRRRLNPMFGAWLMEWPCWWTNPGITSCARSAMELYRFRQQSALSSLLGEPGFSSVADSRP
jgi:site-specific DNA-cytosine methylase